MASLLRELKYILTLDPARFTGTLAKVKSDVEAVRRQTGKPLTISANVKGVVDGLGKIGLAVQGLRTIAEPLRQINSAFLEQEKSIRKIEAASKLTGTGLESLRQTSAGIQEEFRLTAQQANEFTVSANKLTAAAGDTRQTGEVLRNLFDLAAGQGLNASEALLRFEQAIKGVDEGTEALFSGKNPIDLYREYGEQIGKSASALTDMEKKQAIVNAILRDGQKLQGEYNKFLQSAAGIQSQNAARVEELRAQLGELYNQGLAPVLRILTPFIEALVSMDAGTRNAGVAMVGFVGVLYTAVRAFTALRVAVIALNASLGPTGWIILGVTAAATAFGVYAASVDDSAEATDKLAESNLALNKTFADGIELLTKRSLADKPLDKLIEQQAFYRGQLQASQKALADLYGQIDRGQAVSPIRIQDTEEQIKRLQAALKAIETLISERLRIQEEGQQKLTKQEQDELNKRREYEFQTNRITLAQYVTYLETRRAALQKELGAENVEFLKFSDNLNRLKLQLQAEVALGNVELPETLEIRAPEISLDNVVKPFAELREVQTEFQAETFAALEEEYNFRAVLLNTNLEIAASVYGEESDIYQAELKKRQEMERNFQAAKIALAQQGAAATLGIAAQMFTVFQGQSKALFEIGKAASIAQGTINAFEAYTVNQKRYPQPWGTIFATLALGLALAQVNAMRQINFQPKGTGFAAGTRRPLTQADLIQSLFTPAGEDGLVGVRQGEFIVNADRTKEFADILQALNAGLLRREDLPQFRQGGMVQFPGGPGLPIPAYQGGGSVTNVTNIGGPAPVINVPSPGGLTREDLDRLVEAIRDVKIEIRSELDALQFFRKHYPGYERDIRKRRI